MILSRIIITIFSFLVCGITCAASLQSVQVKKYPDKTSVFCVLSGQPSFDAFTLKNPERAIIDLDETSLSVDLDKLPLNNSIIQHIRDGHPLKGVLRLVFDVKRTVTVKVQRWQPKNDRLRGLRIDLIEEAVLPVKSSTPKALRDVLVVIDPGHGGKDSGALGTKRNAEKKVVLAIARQLKKLVNQQPGMKAVLTRNGDYFVGLRKRLNIARKHDADIFVSIHADAFVDKRSSGASVFALSPSGATSEAARWLAEKENYSELGGVDLSDLDDDSGLLRTVLIDLSQTATIRASVKMGQSVLKYIDDLTDLHHGRVEQARFVVLKSPDIPSILVETGFISNPREEKQLMDPAYQNKLTHAILSGIKQYFWEFPPRGTHIEAASIARVHYVLQGESLTAIAERYKTTVSAIKTKNALLSSRIYSGQKLIIPESLG